MPKEFSSTEQSIIKNMMLSTSHKNIAALLGCDKNDIEQIIRALTKDSGVVTHQMKLDQRAGRSAQVKIKWLRPPCKAAIEKQKKQQEKEARMKQQQINELERKIRRQLPKFKTREVDYSKLITVKIDHKTFLQVPPDTDVEKLKKKYLQRVKDSKTEAIHYKHINKQ